VKLVQIRQLDAGFIYGAPSSVESWEPFLSLNTNDTYVVPASRELQKFAELIIKECLELNAGELTYPRWLDLKEIYKEHLGVL
jgi:hypothetical protein